MSGGAVKQVWAPAAAAVCIPVAVVTAYLLDRSLWLAALGAGLVLVYWLLEMVALRLGSRGTFNRAIAVGIGGMLTRMIVVLGALAIVGLLTTRPDTLTCIAAFIGTFTVYFVVRLSVMPFQLQVGPAEDTAVVRRPGREGAPAAGRRRPPDVHEMRPAGHSSVETLQREQRGL